MVSTKNGGHHCGYSKLRSAVGAGRTLTHDLLADSNNSFVEEVMEEDAAGYITEVLGDVLNQRELQVVVARYGIGGAEAQTLATLSEIMGVSKERVRQIECEALKKLRESEHAECLLEILE